MDDAEANGKWLARWRDHNGKGRARQFDTENAVCFISSVSRRAPSSAMNARMDDRCSCRVMHERQHVVEELQHLVLLGVCPVRAPPSLPLLSSLATETVGVTHRSVIDVAVIEEPEAAEVSLDPVRSRLLAELAEPGSATSLAGTLGLPPQNVNYHLKALERHGLVELAEERKKGNMTERVGRASALSCVISPAVLDGVQPDPSRAPDRLSARWLIAVTARAVRDVGQLVAGATKARKRLATFAMDGEIRFASAADRSAFAEELAASVTSLVSKYHDEKAPRGRDHRLIVAVRPSLKDDVPIETANTPVASDGERGTEMAHPFELTHEFEVDASPEEVWDAIATGPGVDAWFMGVNEIEPREGGTTRMKFRGSTEEATVTAWEPPTRFASRTPEGEDGALHAFEYLVEGRDKGSTVIRWVHSGFLGDNWEREYEGLSEGDPMYFDKLRVYLTYFRGRKATPVNVFGGPLVPDRDEAWATFHRGLGLSGPPQLGDKVRLTPQGLPELDGEVDWLSRDFLGVRTDDGIYRFMHISVFGGPTGVGHHIFVDGLDQAETEAAWQTWLEKLFT